jgi:HEAT repeat protein
MSNYKNLIAELSKNKKSHKQAYDTFVKSGTRAISFLVKELQNSPDASMRETCAEILYDIGRARAVPALIKSLKDENEYVRHDALWAIGRLCGFRPGGLEYTLLITCSDPPSQLHTKVSEWWRVNKRFITKSYMLW